MLALASFACQLPEGEEVGADTDADVEVDGGRPPLICDAHFYQVVRFELTVGGAPYCGDLSITYGVDGTEATKECVCGEDPYTNEDILIEPGYMWCSIDPGYGTFVVRVDAPGYETLEQTIELPYACGRKDVVQGELVPL
jgi:hypothetical protein